MYFIAGTDCIANNPVGYANNYNHNANINHNTNVETTVTVCLPHH